MPLKAPISAVEIQIFISSSSAPDVEPSRNRIQQLIDVVNAAFTSVGSTWRVQARHWEAEMAQKAVTENLNDLFIRIALDCHHTVALLAKDLRQGTKGEILAVLDHSDIGLSVLIFPPGGDINAIDADLSKFLSDYGNRLLYKVCGAADSDDAWLILTETVLQAVFRYTFKPEESYVESR